MVSVNQQWTPKRQRTIRKVINETKKLKKKPKTRRENDTKKNGIALKCFEAFIGQACFTVFAIKEHVHLQRKYIYQILKLFTEK